uniref:Uncharacterized protein n=1 Tax=Candidatus Kentrum sp. TUN TaxID=2126343 RepID=A0A450ZBQ1_9GAMM|nr:MAG: hypothetical protein BECKTUN1418D_GA0071000_100626 [Candidatus Kentron sp. TUN]
MAGIMGNPFGLAACLCAVLLPHACPLPYRVATIKRPTITETYPMLNDLERKKVVQHILNLAGIAEDLSTKAASLTEQVDDLAKALEIECEFVPFDEDAKP